MKILGVIFDEKLSFGHHQAYHLSGIQPDSPVLKFAVRVADETSNRTIECPVLAQMIIF
jgi:hypothetical protein